MAILIQDSFTDTNGTLVEDHTPEIGGAWNKVTGISATIQSNEVDVGGSENPLYINSISDVADVYSQIKKTQNDGFLLIGRYTDINNYYFFDEGTGIRKFVAGTPSTLAAYATLLSVGEVAKLEIVGTTLNLYVDDVLKATTTDSSFSTGKVGFRCLGGIFGNNYDDFEAGGAVALPPDAPENLTATCLKTKIPAIHGFSFNFV